MTLEQRWSQIRLEEPETQIRLLEFLDNGNTNELSFSCTHWSLLEAPPFSAVSYTWGPGERDYLLHIDEKPCYVQRNSQYALWQARLNFPEEYVWIDFICINQSDLHEKSFQVAMMGDIYKQACRVLACVGPHANESEIIFEMMPLEQDLVGDLRTFYLDGLNYAEWMLSRKEADLHRLCLASQAFEARVYWTRSWILQEISLARSLFVLCGQDRMSWKQLYFMIFVAFMGVLDEEVCISMPDLPRPEKPFDQLLIGDIERYRLDPDVGFNLWNVIHEFQYLGCYDLRDRVYAFLSLMKRPPVHPDYTLSNLDLALQIINFLDIVTVKDLLQALQITLSASIFETLMERLKESQRSNRVLQSPSRNVYQITSPLPQRYCDIQLDRTGKLTAALAVAPNITDTFRCRMRQTNDVSSFPLDCTAAEGHRKIWDGSNVAAIVCKEAEIGDVLAMYAAKSLADGFASPLLVLRHTRDEKYDIVGQGFMLRDYTICGAWHQRTHETCKCGDGADHAMLKADVEVVLLPEEVLFLVAQDFNHLDSFDINKRVQRLATPVTVAPSEAARIIKHDAAYDQNYHREWMSRLETHSMIVDGEKYEWNVQKT